MNPLFRLIQLTGRVAMGFALCNAAALAEVTVSNVSSAQRPGTKLVDIDYDVAGDAPPFSVCVRISADDGATFAVPANSLSGAFGAGITEGRKKRITWNAGVDWNGKYTPQMRFEVTATDRSSGPIGWTLIPGSSFLMGDEFNEGNNDERPVHTVNVKAFHLATHEVTYSGWRTVHYWAIQNGYTFSNAGQGKAADHPVQTVSWHDVVKWCNAKSEMDELAPCYTVNGAIYRSGEAAPACNWVADGYRLPTEAEWELAARGGLGGKRFPSGDNINHNVANYFNGKYPYESIQGAGYHPLYATGGYPYTSPVGSFPSNDFGLFDMAGNVWEWCWDWHGPLYYSDPSAVTNPQGPSRGTYRVIRGGGWSNPAFNQRVARRYANGPLNKYGYIGFRLARSL